MGEKDMENKIALDKENRTEEVELVQDTPVNNDKSKEAAVNGPADDGSVGDLVGVKKKKKKSKKKVAEQETATENNAILEERQEQIEDGFVDIVENQEAVITVEAVM